MFLGCNTITKSNQLWIFSNMLGFLTGCRFESVSTVNILIFCTTFSFVFSNNLITQDPTDLTKTEGSSGFLSCYTNCLSSLYSIKWLQDDQVISDGDVVVDQFNDRFTAYSNFFGDQQQNSLQIDNIQREDGSHLYSCVLFYNGTKIKQSNTAEIKVLEIPTSRYPECVPITGKMTNESPSTITCRSERTNPLPSLRLLRNGDEKISCKTKNESNYITIEHTFTPTVAEETFMCVLETPAKKEYRHNCSFGPFNVMHRPDMTITGDELVIEGKEVIFICHGKGNPSQVKYEWEFIPNLPEGSYKFESLNSILRLTPTYEMRSTKLVCVGTNSIGESSTYLILNITSRQDIDEIHPPILASAKPSTGKDSKNLMATVLSVAGTCLLVISVLAASTICYIYLCFRKNFHPLGYKIAQPDVYSEPRDSLPPPVLSTDRVARWQKRNVGIQVSLDYNVREEPLYSETPTAKVITETETTPEETPQNKSATYV